MEGLKTISLNEANELFKKSYKRNFKTGIINSGTSIMFAGFSVLEGVNTYYSTMTSKITPFPRVEELSEKASDYHTVACTLGLISSILFGTLAYKGMKKLYNSVQEYLSNTPEYIMQHYNKKLLN